MKFKRRFKDQMSQKSNWEVKRVRKIKIEDAQKKKFIDPRCESKIKALVQKHVLLENIYTFWHCYSQWNTIKFFSTNHQANWSYLKVVWPEVSNRNYSVINKNKKDEIHFSKRERSREIEKDLSVLLPPAKCN